MAIYRTNKFKLYGDFDGYTRSGNCNLIISLWIKGQGTEIIGTVNCDFWEIVDLLKTQKKKNNKPQRF